MSTMVVHACRAWVARGGAALVAPFLVHVVLALETPLPLCEPVFLPWRVEVHRFTGQVLAAAGCPKGAVRLHTDGLTKVREILRLQALDPIPCPAETQAIYDATVAGLAEGSAG